MADEKLTPDQAAAESIGRAIDGRIYRLEKEKAELLKAAERIAEIDAELAILASEQEKIAARRPPRASRTQPPATEPAPTQPGTRT